MLVGNITIVEGVGEILIVGVILNEGVDEMEVVF